MRASKAWSKVHNNREAILWDRLHRPKHRAECTICPRNHGENESGSISRWGRKAARKREYLTGRGLKPSKKMQIGFIYQNHRRISVIDKRNESGIRRKKKMQVDRGEIAEMLDFYIKYLAAHRKKIENEVYQKFKKKPFGRWPSVEVGIVGHRDDDEIDSVVSLRLSFKRKD